MFVLIFNAMLYVMWLFFTLHEEKKITIYSTLIAIITVVAIVGVYSVATGIWSETYDIYDFDDVPLLPYILSFVCFIFLFYPLKGLRNVNFVIKEFSSSNFSYFVIFWIVLSIALVLIRITEVAAAVALGLDTVYEARHVQGDILTFMEHQNPVVAKISGIGSVFCNIACPIMLLYSAYLLQKKDKRIWLSILIMLLAVLPRILYGIAVGSRGEMVWALFRLVFIYVLSIESLSKKIKRKLSFAFSGALALVLIYSIATSIARETEKESAGNGIVRYFGEPFPNVGLIYWDNVQRHPMGDRFFPDFTGFSKDIGESSGDFMLYWWNYTGVPIINWKIYYIDFYIEYGPFLGFIFIVIMSLIFRKYFKKLRITIYNISIVFAYYELCNSSFTGFNVMSDSIIRITLSILFINVFFYLLCNTETNSKNNDT